MIFDIWIAIGTNASYITVQWIRHAYLNKKSRTKNKNFFHLLYNNFVTYLRVENFVNWHRKNSEKQFVVL